jgi:hypothetical protein
MRPDVRDTETATRTAKTLRRGMRPPIRTGVGNDDTHLL